MPFLIRCCFCLFILLLSSCSIRSTDSIDAISSSPESPVLLSLSQAYILDRTIMLKMQIEAKTRVETGSTVVGLIGLKEGAMKEEQYVILSSLVPKDYLFPNERIIVPFSLESGDLTEFQAKLFWGKEGREVIQNKIFLEDSDDLGIQDPFIIEDASAVSSISETDGTVDKINLLPPDPVRPSMVYDPRENILEYLRIDEMEIYEEDLVCDFSRCPKKIKMKGVLKNITTINVSKVQLAFGLFWVPDGKLPLLPDEGAKKKASEEALSFGDKILEPNEGVEFEVQIGRPVYTIPGGDFMPHVRVLDYSIE
jgi:hypothetical protein